jgi:hypothetical protein
MEITLVGIYAETSPAYVSMTGSAVSEPLLIKLKLITPHGGHSS